MEESANRSSVDQEQRSESKSSNWVTFDASTAVGKNNVMMGGSSRDNEAMNQTGNESRNQTGNESRNQTGNESRNQTGNNESRNQSGNESRVSVNYESQSNDQVVATIEPSHSIQMSRSTDHHPLTTPSSSSDFHIFGTDVHRIDTIGPVSPSQIKSSDQSRDVSRDVSKDVSRSQSVPDDRFEAIPSSSRPTSLAFNSGSKNRRFSE